MWECVSAAPHDPLKRKMYTKTATDVPRNTDKSYYDKNLYAENV